MAEVVAAAAVAAVAGNQHCSPISAENKTMKLMHSIKTLAVTLLLAIGTPAPTLAAQPAPTAHKAVQKSFATPEDAAMALVSRDRARLLLEQFKVVPEVKTKISSV